MQKKYWIIAGILSAGIFFGILAGSFFSLAHDLPEINRLKQYKPSSVTTVYSADKKIVGRFYTEKRFPVPVETIPKILIQAVLTIEDRDFFTHSGINFKAILRAILQDIRAGHFKQGGSTLTQQLAKTLFLTSEKSVVRKIKEALLSLQIERRYTKNEILELYLNQIYLGSGAFGVEAAAQTYFGKPVADISIAEAALIAGLPKAPSVYSPRSNPDLAVKRRDVVLNQMRATGMITENEYQLARSETLSLARHDASPGKAPYFLEYVKKTLDRQYDLAHIFSGGLDIHTSLDMALQAAAEAAVKNQMERLKTRMEKNGKDASGTECALIALDVKTGGILSMVGGKDYDKSAFNRAVQARRQPGSAFKPFVYATAVSQGFSQKDTLLDAPLSYPLSNGKTWQVNNFSKTYSGRMTFRKALALSKNTPIVRLMEKIGPEKVIEFARNAGISSQLYPNLSLALGTSEVSLLELTAAYIPFANTGIRVEPFCVTKIVGPDSRLIHQAASKKRSIMSGQDAAVMADMLKAVILEGTGRTAARVIQKDIAGKTGTTDSYKDALFIGFSPDVAVGVWVGNDDATPLGRYETGAKAALPIWIEYMKFCLSRRSYQYFDIPDGTKMIYMDPDTGKITDAGTRGSVKALVKIKDLK